MEYGMQATGLLKLEHRQECVLIKIFGHNVILPLKSVYKGNEAHFQAQKWAVA